MHERMMIALNFCWPIYLLARPIGGEYLQQSNSPTTCPTSIAESIDTYLDIVYIVTHGHSER